MKSIIFILVGLLSLIVLLNIAADRFDNAQGEFITDATEAQVSDSQEETSETESESELVNIYDTYDFTVVDENGNDVKRSDLTGRPMIVFFWTSWSGYTTYELPAIEQAYTKYKDVVNFMVIAIIDGDYETLESAKNYIASSDFTFPVYFDVYSEAFHSFGLYGFPNASRAYLFYSDGSIAKRSSASMILYADDLEEGIATILQ